MKARRLYTGYSLVELLVVLVIVAILAGLAWPAWREQVMQTRRSSAVIALTELAARLEMYYTDHSTYEGAMLGTRYGDIFPPTTEDGFYRLAISRQDAGYYKLSAAPTSRGNQQADRCGIFTLDALGNRTADGPHCWR